MHVYSVAQSRVFFEHNGLCEETVNARTRVCMCHYSVFLGARVRTRDAFVPWDTFIYPWSFFIGATSSAAATLADAPSFSAPRSLLAQTRLCPISRAHVNIHSSGAALRRPAPRFHARYNFIQPRAPSFLWPSSIVFARFAAAPEIKMPRKNTRPAVEKRAYAPSARPAVFIFRDFPRTCSKTRIGGFFRNFETEALHFYLRFSWIQRWIWSTRNECYIEDLWYTVKNCIIS